MKFLFTVCFLHKVINGASSIGSIFSPHGWSTQRAAIVHIAYFVSYPTKTRTREVVLMCSRFMGFSNGRESMMEENVHF
jgi:hypothetical protein